MTDVKKEIAANASYLLVKQRPSHCGQLLSNDPMRGKQVKAYQRSSEPAKCQDKCSPSENITKRAEEQ